MMTKRALKTSPRSVLIVQRRSSSLPTPITWERRIGAVMHPGWPMATATGAEAIAAGKTFARSEKNRPEPIATGGYFCAVILPVVSGAAAPDASAVLDASAVIDASAVLDPPA